MESTYNVRGLKAAILAMSFLQMATNAIASILADIATAFPGVSTTTVQYLMTFPNLLVVVMSVVAARLASRVTKRTLALTGQFLGVMAGICSYLFHKSLGMLFVWAGFLGIGIGLVVPMATSLISDYFDRKEKDVMLGYQTAAANVGSMMMTFLGGIIAVWGWYYNYLVYLLAIPGIVLTMLFVPHKNATTDDGMRAGTKTEVKIPTSVWIYFIIAAMFMLLFYMGPTNLSMLVEEREIGSTMTAGTAATLLLLGGAITGLFFGVIAGKIGRNTIPFGFFMMAIGYLLIYRADETVVLYLGSFLVGTSNTLVLPQCMGSVVTQNKEQSTFLMSAVFSIANLGTFLAPILTGISTRVMGNSSAASRFLFTGLTALFLMAVFGICVNLKKGEMR